MTIITLIVTSDSAPRLTGQFSQPSLIIGGENSPNADLKLQDPSLHDQHLEIAKQVENGKIGYFVINLANDPFTTVNNIPFGKQPLFDNDEIQVGEMAIRFKCKQAESEQGSSLSDPSQNLSSSVQKSRLSLKDDYLSEYDDLEGKEWPGNKDAQLSLSPQMAKSWRTALTLISGFFCLISIIVSTAFFWMNDQTEKEEITAAKGVADIAMSLTYSRLKPMNPQNQNWSSPELIKSQLTQVLAPNYLPLADIDAHGQFVDFPYLLRIYTSSDFSHFIVIAQPSPSLLQWLIPKASIIVDSKAMEMRKIADLKALNRLIASTNSLDGSNAVEISNLIKQGELIPPSTLVSKAENQGFALPESLEIYRPGAENLLYNAPRYYLLGENLLIKSLDLIEKLAKNQETDRRLAHQFPDKEMSLFHHELDSLLQFPNIVLYSTRGIRHALKAQQALESLVPQNPLIVAYLQLNSQGKIGKTHLLSPDIAPDVAMGEKSPPLAASGASINEGTGNEISPHFDPSKFDDPVFMELSALANGRQSALKPITEELIDLLKKEAFAAQPDFDQRFAKLQKRYQRTEEKQKTKIFKKFEELIHENRDLPSSKFMQLVQAADLKVLFMEYLLMIKQQPAQEQDIDTDDFLDSPLKEWLPLIDGV